MNTIPNTDTGVVTLPASCGQERLWFLHQWEHNRLAYNVPLAFDFFGPLRPEALQAGCEEIVRRHEVLRTTFAMDSGELLQIIHDEAQCPFELVDLSTTPDPERESRALAIAHHFVHKAFDLERGPLVRLSLVRFSNEIHRLLINAHHIVCDGWSFEIFLRELAAYYRSSVSGNPADLDPLPIQYGDYAVWQRDWLKSAACAGQLSYWKEHLRELPEPLALPADRPASAQQDADGADLFFELPADLTTRIESFCRQEKVTLYLVLMAAFEALLHWYTGQRRFLVGTAVANRSRVELEGLIGFFVNTVVLRADFDGQPTFRELLSRLREEALSATAHADLPFEKLIEQLQPDRRNRGNPLFRALFVLQEQSLALPEFASLRVQRRALALDATKFDLLFEITSGSEALKGLASYSTTLFLPETIRRMVRHFEFLLRSVLAAPDQPISSVSIIDDDERQQLLTWGRGAHTSYPAGETIHAVFEGQVAETPDGLALIDGDLRLSYAELNARANRYAQHLRAQGLGEGDHIGVFTRHTWPMIAGIIGILKTGAAYVPLDPRDPPARMAILRKELSGVIDERLDVAAESAEQCSSVGKPDGPAYVMFTSGSTGEPKGVVVSHRGVTRLVCATDYVKLDKQTVMMQGSNPCFDAATFEIWGALLNGGTLVLTASHTVLDHIALAQHIAANGINSLFLTTSLFNQHARHAPELFAGLRCVVFGGEAADPSMTRRILEHGRPQLLVNGYGPTETTTFAVCHQLESPAETVPIGRPIANTNVFVLNEQLQLVPTGITAEIYIGGPGVALGYLHKPDLTAERFVETSLGRLYRTGDFGRWRIDGTIEYQGRIDEQFKVRGFRIEPAEIEAQLRRHPAIGQCAVLPRIGPSGDKLVVAYLVCRPGERAVAEAEFRSFLIENLPAMFVPSQWFWLESMPLTANGKLDARALPDPTVALQPMTEYLPPENSVQAHLVEIWEEVLQRRPIGIRDDFFALGGHSLLVARVVTLTLERLGHRLPFAEFFANPTIAHMASLLKDRQRLLAANHSWVLLNENQPRAPFFFLHGDFNGGGFYCRSLAHYSGGDRPFYALHPAGLHGDPIPTTIEEMAAQKLRDLRKIQPEGTYLLGGYCNGGLVAFEMARQIEAEGGKVPLVILLYSLGTNAQWRYLKRAIDLVGAVRCECVARRQRRFLRWRETFCFLRGARDHYLKAAIDMIKQTPAEQTRRIARKSSRVFHRLFEKRPALDIRPATALNGHTPGADLSKANGDAYVEAVTGYVPKRFGGRIVLLWPQDEKGTPPQGPASGWTEVCADVRLVLVPGEHDSCIERDPNLRIVGQEMGRALEEIDAILIDQPTATEFIE